MPCHTYAALDQKVYLKKKKKKELDHETHEAVNVEVQGKMVLNGLECALGGRSPHLGLTWLMEGGLCLVP